LPCVCGHQFVFAFFCLQAEGGIRVRNVTGVQTCALALAPITDPAIGDRTHPRDPKVWKSGDHWYLVLGSTVGEKYGEVLFYRSEIGRASCRERTWSTGGAGAVHNSDR